jgi:multiple sugar transport system ATP-binding protein
VLGGVRPEHIYDPRVRPAETRTTEVQAKVDLTELMGNEVFVHTTVGDARLLARMDPRSGARAGQEFTLGVDYDRIHAFDRETGQNLAGRKARSESAAAPAAG